MVLRGPIDSDILRKRWEVASAGGAELALCYELAPGHDGCDEALLAQRAVTEALRRACGADAEKIAIFAVSDRDGERVEDYATAWGATIVSA
jgi:hypothetical protein